MRRSRLVLLAIYALVLGGALTAVGPLHADETIAVESLSKPEAWQG